MVHHEKGHPRHPRGIVTNRSWQSAIQRNGMPPTIYHSFSAGGPIPGFTHKSPAIGKWSGGYHGRHS